jgi:release factor glutamine methyltransferase
MSENSTASVSLGELLEKGRNVLAICSGADAGRESLFLMAGMLEMSPAQIVLHRDRVLGERERGEYESRLARRAKGEPLQYIEGRAAFRDLFVRVDPSVLIPRPETEQLVEHVLEWCRGREALSGLDLGTGSGAIAMSLALEGPFRDVVAVDISPHALNVARHNISEAGVDDRVDLRRGSLFAPLGCDERFHIVVSNPPYVALGEADSLPAEVRDWEPKEALFAGATGLEVIEKIVGGASQHLMPGGLLAIELAPDIAEAAARRVEAKDEYGSPRLLPDLAGHTRILLAERQ